MCGFTLLEVTLHKFDFQQDLATLPVFECAKKGVYRVSTTATPPGRTGSALLAPSPQAGSLQLQKQLMESLLARVFKEAIADGDFAFLADKWLKVDVSDLELCWFISEQNGQLVVARECDKADVCFSGTANDLILIAGRKRIRIRSSSSAN